MGMFTAFNRVRYRLIGNFSNDDGNGPIVTIFDCPILFAFCIVGKVRYKWTGVRDVKLNTKN